MSRLPEKPTNAETPDRAASLLPRLLAGDNRAWEELVSAHYGLLVGIARRTFATHGFAAAHQDAEDAVAAVWRNLLDQDGRLLRQAQSTGSLLPLLVTLTRHRAVDFMRRRKLFTVPLDDIHPHLEAAAADTTASTAETLEFPASALDVLNPKERNCIRLFFLQGRRYAEIEKLTGIPLNSIGPTLGRALAKLRAKIAPARNI